MSAALRAAPAANLGEARSADSGLVSLSTTDTRLVEIDLEAARLKRMKRRVCKAAEVHEKAMRGSQNSAPAMVTLTYRRMEDWRPDHLTEALKRVRQWLKRRGESFRYVWVAELQDRGVIHYHIVTWFPATFDKNGDARKAMNTPPFWDDKGWWPHGTSRSEWAERPVGYIASYTSKVGTKDKLPGGARMHGSGGFTPLERQRMAFHSKPTWVRQLSQIGQRITRPKGGGIVQHYMCGLKRRLASPFVLVSRVPGRVVLAMRGTEQGVIRSELNEWWSQWLTNRNSPSSAMTATCRSNLCTA